MADIKISQLGAAVAVADADVIPATANGVTVKVPASVLKEYAIGGTDISSIGDGTPTGAISALKSVKIEKTDIAPIETLVTSKAYAVGDQLYYNGMLYSVIAAIAQGETLVVDTNIELSDKVTEQIKALQGSVDLVNADLQKEVTTRATLGAHNFLPLSIGDAKKWNTTGNWNGNTYTLNGVTFTFSVIGESIANIAVSGTASDNISLLFLGNGMSSFPYKFKAGNYILSGNPSSEGTIALVLAMRSPSGNHFVDIGNGISVNLETDTYCNMYFYIPNGKSVNGNLRPLLRLASDPSTKFTPYAMTNRELTEARAEAQTGKFGTLTVSSINTAEGNYAFTGSGYITIADVMTVGKKHLIKVAVRQLYMTPTTLSGEVGGSIILNNKTPLQNVNDVLGTSFTSLNVLNDTFKSSFRTYDDNNKRCSITMSMGANGHYLQVYMPDGNGMFHVPNYVWWAWCE